MEDNRSIYTENEETESTATEEEMQQAQKTGIVDFSTKKETKAKSANYTHTFQKPVEIEGRTYTTLTFYFEDLCGEDIEAIEEELLDQSKYVLTPEISSPFQARLAARAANIPSDAITRLPVRDYMAIKNKTRNFLISMA